MHVPEPPALPVARRCVPAARCRRLHPSPCPPSLPAQAYISQMVFLLAPLLVSGLALALLRTPLPPRFWPTLLLMLAGAGMVAGGKAVAAAQAASAAAAGGGGSAQAPPPPGPGSSAGGGLLGLTAVSAPGLQLGLLAWRGAPVLSLDEAAGVGLSLLSALSLAAFMLTLQVGGGGGWGWAGSPARSALRHSWLPLNALTWLLSMHYELPTIFWQTPCFRTRRERPPLLATPCTHPGQLFAPRLLPSPGRRWRAAR